ncbi:DUF5694 domain-containing protein [Spirosoma areae]
MKPRLASLLLLTIPFTGHTQPNPANQHLEILLIGASHQYGKTPVEHFEYPLGKALAFRPDAVFGEDLSPQDYDALADFWNKAALEKRVAYVRSHTYPDPKQPAQFIQQTYKLLGEHPTFHQDRMKLARALYLAHDFGNARYQLYRLDQAKITFGQQERDAYRAILGEPDSLYRSRSSEYHNIFFPLLDKLKQDRILPMDAQQYDLPWQAAWNRTDSLFRRWEASLETDTNTVAARRYAALMKRMNELTNREKQAAQAGNQTQFMNAPEGDEFLNIANFYGARRLFGLADFPEKTLSDMLHYWQLRNEGMCRNVVSRARLAGAKRIVVGVGANHRQIMVETLRAMPNVTVYTLNEYQPE